MVLAPEELQHLLSQQDVVEKISDKQTRQDLEIEITRIRNTRALKKSKQADKRKQKKFVRKAPQWNIDPEYFRSIAKQKKIYEKIRQELEIKMTRIRKSRVKQKLKRKGRSRSQQVAAGRSRSQ
jgi:hypothetical protein